jgi:hypothetical protein
MRDLSHVTQSTPRFFPLPQPHLLVHRRLTPNFRVRVEVHYRGQVSFPLTLKCYVVTQQDKDSIPEWVPEDFLDPDLPQVGAGVHSGAVVCCCAVWWLLGVLSARVACTAV